MQELLQVNLKELTETSAGPCMTVYMPMHQAGADIQQDMIRFKNLLRKAQDQLVEQGMKAADVEKFLAPASELLQSAMSWRSPSPGFAMFLAPGFFEHYRLPIEVKEQVFVGDAFHIKPLLPGLTGDGLFYLLALSQDRVRLFQGTRFSLQDVDLKDLPDSLAEAMKYDDPEKQLQSHTTAAPNTVAPGNTSGARSAIFHGHGGGTDNLKKEKVLEYFKMLDKGLQPILGERNVPLVLAGVEYLTAIYREVNSYGVLVDGAVKGNPDGTGSGELHRSAWELVGPYYSTTQREAADQYKRLAGTGKTSNSVEEIVPAAVQGRVGTLFVAVDAHRWGSLNGDGEVDLHETPQNGAHDLLDIAAVRTMQNRGMVFAVESDAMPDGEPIAAVFRY